MCAGVAAIWLGLFSSGTNLIIATGDRCWILDALIPNLMLAPEYAEVQIHRFDESIPQTNLLRRLERQWKLKSSISVERENYPSQRRIL